MQITLFASDDAPQGVRRDLSWGDLCTYLRTPRDADVEKRDLRGWSPATFADDYRCDEGVECVSLLVFDVDVEPVPRLEDMARLLSGVQWFAHTSSSSTSAAPRWRLLVSLSRPLTAEEYPRAWRAFVERLPFQVGPQSKNPGRFWYEPRRDVEGGFVVGASQ